MWAPGAVAGHRRSPPIHDSRIAHRRHHTRNELVLLDQGHPTAQSESGDVPCISAKRVFSRRSFSTMVVTVLSREVAPIPSTVVIRAWTAAPPSGHGRPAETQAYNPPTD